jgi:hypothetical protein
MIAVITGCTPAARGAAGVTVDASGAPIVVVTGCGRSVTRVSVIYRDSDGSQAPRVTQEPEAGAWESSRAGGLPGRNFLNLSTPGPDWRVIQPLAPLKKGVGYKIRGRVGEGEAAAPLSIVDLTVEQLRTLTPDKVLMYADQPGTSRIIVPLAQFEKTGFGAPT